jgi:hypothetical protein
VEISGAQWSDGRIERLIFATTPDSDSAVGSDEARAICQAFIDAGDEIAMLSRDRVADLLTAHDHLIEAHAALVASGLDGARATRACQIVAQLHDAADCMGDLIDALKSPRLTAHGLIMET